MCVFVFWRKRVGGWAGSIAPVTQRPQRTPLHCIHSAKTEQNIKTQSPAIQLRGLTSTKHFLWSQTVQYDSFRWFMVLEKWCTCLHFSSRTSCSWPSQSFRVIFPVTPGVSNSNYLRAADQVLVLIKFPPDHPAPHVWFHLLRYREGWRVRNSSDVFSLSALQLTDKLFISLISQPCFCKVGGQFTYLKLPAAPCLILNFIFFKDIAIKRLLWII